MVWQYHCIAAGHHTSHNILLALLLQYASNVDVPVGLALTSPKDGHEQQQASLAVQVGQQRYAPLVQAEHCTHLMLEVALEQTPL